MLLILCGGLHLSQSEKLKCQFGVRTFSYVGNVYFCFATSLDNSLNIMTIDDYTGAHLANKNDNDVNGIFIQNTNTKYIPANLGFLFNLTAFIVRNSNLIEIKAENFLGMQNLEFLSLFDNKLTSLASDTFSSITKLKYIGLSFNQIEMIPSNLFSNNLNLVEINLNNNKIKHIGSGVFDGLKKLIKVDLSGNICIDNGFSDINQLKEDDEIMTHIGIIQWFSYHLT